MAGILLGHEIVVVPLFEVRNILLHSILSTDQQTQPGYYHCTHLVYLCPTK